MTTTFNFGAIPHTEIMKSMRLFARSSCRRFARAASKHSGISVHRQHLFKDARDGDIIKEIPCKPKPRFIF